MTRSTQISDISANIIHHVEYMPYGEAFVEQRSNWGTNYKFNGKELDEETGFYYYGARYYNPDISIWLSVDPLADKYPSLSPYNYCANNPIKYVDPDGRDIFIVCKYDAKFSRETEKKSHERIISWLASSETGNAIIQEFINNPDRDVYIIMGNVNRPGADVHGVMDRYFKNGKLGNPETIDIGRYSHMNQPESPFHLTLIDKNKENYFIILNEDMYGKGRNSMEGAMVLGHEMGAHTKNIETTGDNEHKIWGQSYIDVPPIKGSRAETLNNEINNSNTRNTRYEMQDQGRGKYKLIEKNNE